MAIMFEEEFNYKDQKPHSWEETCGLAVDATNYKKQLLRKPPMIPFVKFTRSNGAVVYLNSTNIAFITQVGDNQTKVVFVNSPSSDLDAMIINESVNLVASKLNG